MTETNQLTYTIERVESMLNQGELLGALNCLEYVKNHAATAVKLINDQAALLTKQQLEIINLNKDVEIQKERADMQYKRAVSAEAEINELDEQDHIAFVAQDGHISWRGSDPVEQIMEDNNLTIGAKFYARPVPAKSVPDGFAIVEIGLTPEIAVAAGVSVMETCEKIGADKSTTVNAIYSDMVLKSRIIT